MSRNKPVPGQIERETGRRPGYVHKTRVQTLGGLIAVLVLAALGFAGNRASPGARPHSAAPDGDRPSSSDQARQQRGASTSAAQGRALSPRLKHTIEQVRVIDQQTGHVYQGPIELSDTLERIAAGGHYPASQRWCGVSKSAAARQADPRGRCEPHHTGFERPIRRGRDAHHTEVLRR